MDATTACKRSVFAIGLAAALASAQAMPALSVYPNPAAAGKSFPLYLQGLTVDCYTTFARETVTVTGNRIDLRYTSRAIAYATEAPAFRACPMPVMAADAPAGATPIAANLPTFLMPALAAGKYEVWAADIPECIYSGCKLALPAPVSAGTLEVARQGWYLEQKVVPPDAPFRMRLLRDSLPACTSFSDLSAEVSASGISASFLPQYGKCAMLSTAPIGPVFAMPALKNGVYPVYVTELLPCELAQPVCIVERERVLPSDTLIVAMTLTARMSALRAGAPKAQVIGENAWFALPAGGTGAWRAELTDLDGRVLMAESFAGAPGDRVSARVGRAPAKAVSLLRLTSPEGTRRYLPIVR